MFTHNKYSPLKTIYPIVRKINIDEVKNIHPRKMFTPENIHPWKIFTPEEKNHPWKIYTPEKYSPLKNIHP